MDHFLIHKNDLPSAFNFLNAITFVDDTNLFFEHKDIRVLCSTVNRKFQNFNEWFISNKLWAFKSFKRWKTNFSIFRKASRRDDLPLALPKLFNINKVIKRHLSIKFLGILLDENLSWKEHLKLTENNIAKNIGLIHKAKPYLTLYLLASYFSYIHSYFNYTNLVWRNTQNFLKKDKESKKHALRLIHNKKSKDYKRFLFVLRRFKKKLRG